MERAGGMDWEASQYDRRCGFVSEFGKSVVELLRPRPGEQILDLGCGTGDLCFEIAKRGALPFGIDFSPDMIAKAKEKYPDLAFAVADAHTYRTDRRFDAVFSNAALHWMKRPRDVIGTVWDTLVPGGRFVAEFGGKGNVGTIVRGLEETLAVYGIDAAARNPWYFPSIGEYAALLEAQGFEVVYAVLFERPTPLPDGERGLRHWLETFGRPFFAGMPEERKTEAYREVERKVRRRLWRDDAWVADYVRIRVVANRPRGH